MEEKQVSFYNKLLNSKAFLIMLPILGLVFGLIFVLLQIANIPITRDKAETYSGVFERYESAARSCEIVFADGSEFNVYPYTTEDEFTGKMESLEKGTPLFLSVNPNNRYVIEVKTESETLLDFESSQQAIFGYGKGYIGIGIFVFVCSVFVSVIGFMRKKALVKEAERQKEQDAKVVVDGIDTPVLRNAEYGQKAKIFLQENFENYDIVYRRVKSVNELVINGRVYDERKAVFEFEHNLKATVGGHVIEAGLDSNNFSYILFDGELIAEDKRFI